MGNFTISLLFRFLYSGACEVNADTVMELTYAASKYDVMTLLRQCITYLEENVNSETVCTILNHAIMFEENMLADRCLMYISKHSTAVFQSENFISLTKDALKDILALDKLNCDELKVYHACKRWATVSNEDTGGKTTKSEINIRKQLGDLLQLVRFPTMDLEEFNEHVLADDVLTTLEINDIQTAIHNNQECPGFSSKRRHPKSNAPIKIETSNRVERGWGCGSKIQEGLTFTLSREMTLRAVGLYLPCVGGSVNGMLSIENDGNVVLCEKVRLRYDKDEKITYRRLAKTIPLTPEHTYVIKFKTEGTCTWLSRLEYETQTISGVDVQFLPELVTDPAYCQIHGFELSTS